jgi:hypothetical protein
VRLRVGLYSRTTLITSNPTVVSGGFSCNTRIPKAYVFTTTTRAGVKRDPAERPRLAGAQANPNSPAIKSVVVLELVYAWDQMRRLGGPAKPEALNGQWKQPPFESRSRRALQLRSSFQSFGRWVLAGYAGNDRGRERGMIVFGKGQRSCDASEEIAVLSSGTPLLRLLVDSLLSARSGK